MERLIVKNFGPFKDVDIELNKINLFIGENGSGKSVLAKIITIVLDFYESDENILIKKFDEFNINFILSTTVIQFFSENHLMLQLDNQQFIFDENILIFKKSLTETQKKSEEFFSSSNSEDIKKIRLMLENKEVKNDDLMVLLEKAELELKKFERLSSQYIPAERNLISLFSKSLSSLVVAEIPLPKFLLKFSSEFEKAGNELKELEFLNVKYVNGDGLDRHKVYFNDDEYLSLEHSSSGIQSVLPLYLTVKYFAQKHKSIIIEEPEQNLFPKAQTETIKYIVEQVSNENNLFMMTHSPYVLSTLNNLIYAHIVAELGEKEKEEVKELINENQWINPLEFSAYFLENGVARNIKSDMGLISDNVIDDISEEMGDEFDELLEIYRASKND